MSDATTLALARKDHHQDLKRLTTSREELVGELERSAQFFAQKAQTIRQNVSEAAGTFLAAKKAEFDAHYAAELAAKGE